MLADRFLKFCELFVPRTAVHLGTPANIRPTPMVHNQQINAKCFMSENGKWQAHNGFYTGCVGRGWLSMTRIPTADTERHCRCTNSSPNSIPVDSRSTLIVMMCLGVAMQPLALRSFCHQCRQMTFSFSFVSVSAFIV